MTGHTPQPRERPPAIVLCMVVTGLATVRALARRGVDVHAFLFDARDPIHLSRHAKKVSVHERGDDEAWLVDFLIAYATKIGGRPVVIPTSDKHALMLARHAERLRPVCRTTTMTLEGLETIVHKNELYREAAKVGVPIVPSLDSPNEDEIAEFSQSYAGPYLLKPLFESSPVSRLRRKNLLLPDGTSLLAHARAEGLDGVVVQPMVRGGDGEIFDTYGLCNAHGEIVTIATHRRLRQFPRDRGTTTLGAIPSGLEELDEVLIDQTRRLLRAVHFHGIFGIEWIRDRERGEFCLIDFNARPFSSIGHLEECGLNLPYLCWRDLAGDDLSDVASVPTLASSVWVNFKRDLSGWRSADLDRREPLGTWARTLFQARSFAYWDPRDPGPFLARLAETATGASNALRQRWVRARRASPSPRAT